MGQKSLIFSVHVIASLFIGEASWGISLWTTKKILRCFALMIELKINFHKSNVIGISVEDNLLLIKISFIFPKLQNRQPPLIIFNYLGLFIGPNSRKEAIWQPVFETMRPKLSWAYLMFKKTNYLRLMFKKTNCLNYQGSGSYRSPMQIQFGILEEVY